MSNNKQRLNAFTTELRKFGVKNILNQQQIANQLNISNYDFITIQILEETGPITAGEIAKRTGISTGSVTALLDRLEKEHYIRRERDPNDRRKVLIVPQYDDKKDVQVLYNNLNHDMLDLFQSYDSSEQQAIVDFLEKASGVLEDNREQGILRKM